MQRQKKRWKPSVTQTIALGFLGMILVGGVLLSLPFAARNGQAIPFGNALFTATSATCVTGLVVYDTATQFSLFGQIVLLCLIQVGGLGFMTMAAFLSMLLGKKIGLKERGLLMESMNVLQLGGVVRLVRRILKGTLLFEGVGAVLLSIRFSLDFGPVRGIYYGVFHAVSAFCNAGFDLMGTGSPYQSLTPYRGDLLVNLVVMALILIGGLGFLVWDDLREHRWHFRRYRLHSKIVLTMLGALTVLPAVIFFFVEQGHSLDGLPLWEQILASLFQVVSPRTAGFNTVDLAKLSPAGHLMTVGLMFVGANPGSTGGGIKTTTFLVVLLVVAAYLRHDEQLNIYGRRLPAGTVYKALCVMTIYLLLALGGTFLILWAQPELGLRDVLFEAVSAMSTVGLTTGITRDLGGLARIVIGIMMYCGRVGSLSLIMAVAERKNRANLRYMEEPIVIG